jgi:segregation and condensation protein B
METNKLKAILEALLFMSAEPLTSADLKKLLNVKEVIPDQDNGDTTTASASPAEVVQEEPDAASQLEAMQTKLDSEISKSQIIETLEEIMKDYAENEAHGFELVEVAKGYQFRTKSDMAVYLRGMGQVSKFRLSAPSMETLAIVAYKQPLPRNKIEEIRGVDSGGVLKTLLDRDLVRIVGRSEEPGRPILYGTTKTFLEVFNLSSLADLPTLKDLEESISQSASASVVEGQEVSEDGFDDFSEDLAAFSEAEEASGELIDELENSMRSLRDLEKKLFEPENKDEASTPPLISDPNKPEA